MSDPQRERAPATDLGARWAVALLLATAEYALISFQFDARTLRAEGALARLLSLAGDLGPLAPAVITALLVFGGAPLIGQLRALGQRYAPPRWSVALLAHALAYGALYATTAALFGDHEQTPPGQGWAFAWLAAVAGWAASLLVIPLRPAAWWRWLADNRALWFGGLALGLGAFLAGWAAGDLWQATSWWALRGAEAVLALLEPEVVMDTEERLLGTPSFAVVVAPVCSGYEGIGLITVFLTGFLVRFREDLFMARALWILPAAVALAWGANVLRIAALIELGTHVSPDAALGGFHSKAGWLAFCVLALGLVALVRRVDWLWKPRAVNERREAAALPNPVAPYLMPLLAMIASALLMGLFTAGFERWYGVRVGAVALALWIYRDVAPVWRPRLSWPALAAGAGVFVMWLVLAPTAGEATTRAFVEALDAMEPGARYRWLFLRTLGTCVTVPIAEELAFRGFLLRRLIDADFDRVDFRRFTWLSFVVSSLAFGLLHQGQWLAATLAGAAYALTQLRTGRLGDAVVAHALTNAFISLYVLGWGQWQWWA